MSKKGWLTDLHYITQEYDKLPFSHFKYNLTARLNIEQGMIKHYHMFIK